MAGPGTQHRSSGTPTGPVAPDVGIVGLVPNRWTDLWQPRHQVMRRLAAYFNVVWVTPAIEWRRMLSRPRVRATDTDGPGWRVLDPPVYLPKVYRPHSLATALERARLSRARRTLAGLGARRTVLYLWRPQFASALETAHDLSVYHIDDEYSSADAPVDPDEARLIRRVDQVIIHSPGLMERKGDLNPNTANVPNGVDFEAFSRPQPMPSDLAAIPGPRIGYAGWLKAQLDWVLVDHLAAARPEWSFAFVGAAKLDRLLEEHPGYRALHTRPNVHFLGGKTAAELASYSQHFDVCIMPYALTAYTDCIYPLKLHEYLAGGRPTVGTPIRALVDYANVVALARSVDEWQAAIAEALRHAPEAGRAARRNVARGHDWNILVARIASLIASRLGHPIAERAAADVLKKAG